MISLRNVSLRRGSRLLLSGVDLGIHAGQRVGLIGANGSGKSSLFALLRGELSADAGAVELPASWVIAHVAQETPPDQRTALDFVLDGDRELRGVEHALAAAQERHDGMRAGELHARYAAIDGYSASARAARLLRGLGFSPGEELREVGAFSGGWRMRLNLAQALMCRSDLLLLDEPTNHLDLDAVVWLEGWLRGYPGTLLLISHDRDFLDRVVQVIAHIEEGSVRTYAGDYTTFERTRALRLAEREAAARRQQREVGEIEAFVARFRYKASKARQAQSRLKALARMEQVAPVHRSSGFSFSFVAPERMPSPLLVLEEVAAGYSGQPVLESVSLSLLPGERIGLLGANGAGKSTLVKLLAGEIVPLAGAVQRANGLAVGYFAQHQLEQLDAAASPLEHLSRLDPGARPAALRGFLGGFRFSGEAAEARVATFSGGEKARLVLALILYARPHLLLLDEPTNHLDLEMRHALTAALQGFSGALVLVSHDRHLLRTTVDRLLLVRRREVREWSGDVDDYVRSLRTGAEDAVPVEPGAAPERDRDDDRARTDGAERGDRRGRRQLAALERRRLKPLQDALHRAEAVLERIARARAALEERLADERLYEAENRDELKGLLIDKARLDHQTAQAEAQWLEAGEALESAGRVAAPSGSAAH